MDLNYSQICSNLLKNLSEKQKEVIIRRFGLNQSVSENRRETLESIGRIFGITRERVRQIEKDCFLKLKPETKKYQKIFRYFNEYFKKNNGLKREDLALEDLGSERWKNQVYFLLTLGENFKRFSENEDFYSFWSTNPNAPSLLKKIITTIYTQLKKIGKPIVLKDPKKINYLEISKKIQKNSEGLWGLKEWPEINPRGIKDKAYLVFQKEKRPLHFTEVAHLIGSALPQTVHNELIKDSRFVLVGRGLYALSDWGYEKGVVRDIIIKILKETKKPLSKEEILEKVLKQRFVKKNTVLLNLSNKKYFSKTPEGLYNIKTKTA